MEPTEYDRMYAQERQHFWFRAMRSIALDQVRDLTGASARVLDAGCGTGGLLSLLPKTWERFGLDLSAQALAYTRERSGAPAVMSDLEAIAFASERFDVVFALDVVEHCSDDAKVVGELARVLKRGGRLVMSVPAFQLLWSAHDDAMHHRRRYRRAQLVDLIGSAPLELTRVSYFNTALFLPIAAVRLGRRWLGNRETASSDTVPLPFAVNEMLYRLFNAERRALRHTDLPFGVSLLVVATRR